MKTADSPRQAAIREAIEAADLLQQAATALAGIHRCKDCDGDCPGVPNHAACHAYQPERGWCPFLNHDN